MSYLATQSRLTSLIENFNYEQYLEPIVRSTFLISATRKNIIPWI